MIDNDISNIFCFYTFSFWYFLGPVFRAGFSIIGQNTGLVIVPKRKNKKFEMLLMLLFDMCDAPQNIFSHFLPIFDHFYPISPAIFALEQKFAIDHFRDPPILKWLGK